MFRLTAIAALLFLRGTAIADDALEADPETIIVIDRKPDREAADDRDRQLGDAPFVTVVHAEDHPATASVADALGSTVGVHTQSLGGLGAYQSISVRGAAPGHTAVLIDGVPLARLAAVTTDLGRFTLDAFGDVELYRGAVPLELGGAGVGGALNLVTRLGRGAHGERVHVSTGAGSFGARHMRARYGDRFGDVDTVLHVGYQAGTGNFSFFNDHDTERTQQDDTYDVRKNNGFSQLDVVARAGQVDRALVGGIRVARKAQGLPGSTGNPDLDSTLTTLDVLGDVRGDAAVGDATARQLGYLLVEHQRIRDPDGRIGLGQQDHGYLTLSGGASSTWSVPVGMHRVVAGVEARADRFRDNDRMTDRDTTHGDREGGAVMAGVDLALDPTVVVTPAVRLDVVRTAPAPMNVGPSSGLPYPTRYDAVPSPRLSARLAAASNVSAKASAGWYVRMPTVIELFGNRGAVIGTPDLRPERGPSADLGIVWAPAAALGIFDRVLVEGSAFATYSHDTIVFLRSVGAVTRPSNEADAQTFGGELLASARIAKMLSITANYTRLGTSQITDNPDNRNKELPREPGHIAYARADLVRHVFGRDASMYVDASFQSKSYLDLANQAAVPARFLVGTGVRLEIAAGIAAAFDVANLTDLRVVQAPLVDSTSSSLTPKAIADIDGFPLPGRTLYLSLEWSR